VRFWDSSALVALLVDESRSGALRELHSRDRAIFAWWATPVECESALSRLVRERALSHLSATGARSRLETLAASWSEVEPDAALRQSARRLVALHPLRAADALQLAAALRACDGRAEDLPFVCLDDRLSEAAGREGFTVLGAPA
jgi:predicted nucleic acid-binding protein